MSQVIPCHPAEQGHPLSSWGARPSPVIPRSQASPLSSRGAKPVPCHPEERSDEGSVPEMSEAREQIPRGACPERTGDSKRREQILRCAQDDREGRRSDDKGGRGARNESM